MRSLEENAGVLFNHFPEFMLFATSLFQSESDFIVKASRIIKNDSNIRAYEQIFRKFRQGTVTQEEFFDYWGIDHAELVDSYGIDPECVGGWCILDSIFRGIKKSTDNGELSKYLDFLLALCEVDKELIQRVRQNSTPIGFDDLNEINQRWLVLSEFDFQRSNTKQEAQYVIGLVLHWAALYEHFLFIDWPELTEDLTNKEPYTKLIDFLPRIKGKGKLSCSVEVFLMRLKTKWGKSKYSKNNISWTTLFQDIARAKKPGSLETRVDPDIQAIKKMFDRWRKNETYLSIDSFKKYIAVLDRPYDPDAFDSSVLLILFVQIFELLQRELLASGLQPKFIVSQFERYDIYLELVARRYNAYCQTGVVNP